MSTTTSSVTVDMGVPGKPEKSHVPKTAERPLPTCLFAILFVVSLSVSVAAMATAMVLATRVDDLERQLNARDMSVIVSSSAVAPSEEYQVATPLVHTGEWAEGVRMPAERSDLHSVLCNGSIVLLGGLNSSDQTVSIVWKFDPILEVYSEAAAPMPTPRFRFGATCHDNKVYVTGGFQTLESGNAGTSLSTTDIYDVALDSWSAGPPLGVARGDLALASVGGHLYAMGGYDWNYDAVATNERLDPVGGTSWVTAAPMPLAKGDLQAAVIGDKVYLPGGWNSASEFLDDLSVYDATKDTWSNTLAPMKAARGDAAVVALHGKVFVLGGETWSGKSSECDFGWGPIECAVNLIPMHGVEMYSPEENVWTSMAPLPEARFRFPAAAVEGTALNGLGDGGVIHSFGGHAHGEVAVNTAWNFHFVPSPPLYFHTRAVAA